MYALVYIVSSIVIKPIVFALYTVVWKKRDYIQNKRIYPLNLYFVPI